MKGPSGRKDKEQGQAMRGRTTILSIALAAFIIGASFLAEAQEHKAARIWRIGWLSPTASATGAVQLDALRKGLAEQGYVEGRNITIEARWADDDFTQLPRLSRALVELNVNIIYSSGTPRLSRPSRREQRFRSSSVRPRSRTALASLRVWRTPAAI